MKSASKSKKPQAPLQAVPVAREVESTATAVTPLKNRARPSKGARSSADSVGPELASKKTPTKESKPKRLARRGQRPKLSPDEVREIFRRFHAIEPEPKGELEHVNPYTLLVAVVLSAQATDAGVNKATRGLFQVADTPQKMLALGEDGLKSYIKTVGLYPTKAKNIIALSKQLVERYGGEVPPVREELEQLPGVGRKSANVVLNMSFGQPTMAVDTHIFRVSNRIGLAPGKDPLAVELNLLKVVPPEYALHAHHWLILHGRYLCKARRPECWRCPIADICRFKEKVMEG